MTQPTQRCSLQKNTKQTIAQTTLTELTATLMGEELDHVQSIIDMYAKVVYDHLKHGHHPEVFHYMSLSPVYRAPYRFQSGLDKKEYSVDAKLKIDIHFDPTTLNQLLHHIEKYKGIQRNRR